MWVFPVLLTALVGGQWQVESIMGLVDDQTSDIEADRHISCGEEAEPHQFPFQALLVAGGDKFYCGGVLIHPEWVLTVAHCVDKQHNPQDGDQFEVRLGVHNRHMSNGSDNHPVNPTNILIHEKYGTKFDLGHDIALIHLRRPAKLSDKVQVIRLPRKYMAGATFEGEESITIGWGMLDDEAKPSNVRFVRSKVISNDDCTALSLLTVIWDCTLCTSTRDGKDSCVGDSGGAVVMQESDDKYTLIGVSSSNDGDCGSSIPSRNLRVTKFLEWIEDKIQRHSSTWK